MYKFYLIVVCFTVYCVLGAGCSNLKYEYPRSSWRNDEPKQAWNYVNVRPNAYMFWWLYYTSATQGHTARPLVIWLQGGPGGSSTGFGNFAEIGPLDVDLHQRNVTWVSEASVLFIDNPVGTGYSYVTNNNAYTKNVRDIAVDLVTTLSAILDQLPDFKTIPLYIFSESYGGKMTAAFSDLLYKTISAGKLNCDFRGLAMGDSWISPIDSVNTWGPYLYATSLVDETGLQTINKAADDCADALAQGKGERATELWSAAESIVIDVTGGVNFYNILQWGSDNMKELARLSPSDWEARLFKLHVNIMQEADLSQLMNGPIRKKLGIIPDSVTWGGQSALVFSNQAADFMNPVVDIVDSLLNSTNLEVVVYSGQLDLIVDVLGTERWVQKLKWSELSRFNRSSRILFQTEGQPNAVAGYFKTYDKFSFYWILDAGHMIPTDAPDAALWMLKKVINVQ